MFLEFLALFQFLRQTFINQFCIIMLYASILGALGPFQDCTLHHRINSASENQSWIYLSGMFSLVIHMSIESCPFRLRNLAICSLDDYVVTQALCVINCLYKVCYYL